MRLHALLTLVVLLPACLDQEAGSKAGPATPDATNESRPTSDTSPGGVDDGACLPASGPVACGGAGPCCNAEHPKLTPSGVDPQTGLQFRRTLVAAQATAAEIGADFQATVVSVVPSATFWDTQDVLLALADERRVTLGLTITADQAALLVPTHAVRVQLDATWDVPGPGFAIVRDAATDALLVAVGDSVETASPMGVDLGSTWVEAVDLTGVGLAWEVACPVRMDSYCQRVVSLYRLIVTVGGLEHTLLPGESVEVPTAGGTTLVEVGQSFVDNGGSDSCTCMEGVGPFFAVRFSRVATGG